MPDNGVTYGPIVSCEFLTVRMGWGLAQIDAAVRNGTIRLMRRNGRTHYQLSVDIPVPRRVGGYIKKEPKVVFNGKYFK